MVAATGAQFVIGALTVLNKAPVSYGTLHQAGAMTLLTACLGLVHAVRPMAPSALGLKVARGAVPLAVAASAVLGYCMTRR